MEYFRRLNTELWNPIFTGGWNPDRGDRNPNAKLPPLPRLPKSPRTREDRQANRRLDRSPTPEAHARYWRTRSRSPSQRDSPESVERSSVVDRQRDRKAKFDRTNQVTGSQPARYEVRRFPSVRNLQKNLEGPVKRLTDAGWRQEAIGLYIKLSMRGYGPLLPCDWQMDFDRFPSIFFEPPGNEAYISNVEGSEFRAFKALEDMINVGPRIRDAFKLSVKQRTPERILTEAINRYASWAFKDGGVDPQAGSMIPIFTTWAGPGDESPVKLQSELARKFRFIAASWRDARQLREDARRHPHAPQDLPVDISLPTLYGIIASEKIFGILTYDIPAEDTLSHVEHIQRMRSVGIFNYDDYILDVYNSLAIAITIIHVRNRMMGLKMEWKDILKRSRPRTPAPDIDV